MSSIVKELIPFQMKFNLAKSDESFTFSMKMGVLLLEFLKFYNFAGNQL